MREHENHCRRGSILVCYASQRLAETVGSLGLSLPRSELAHTILSHFFTLGVLKVKGKSNLVTGKGRRLKWVCPGTVWNAWALDFMQESFHERSPGDFESMFIKAGDSETKKGLMVEEARS